MNTIRSVWLGWGTLCLAGGTAYLLAKRSINADRNERHQGEMKRRRIADELEYSASQEKPNKKARKALDKAASLSSEATEDPALTRHASSSGGEDVQEKSKYEASVPYRSKKGNRLS
ncbi:MAG: hypothetical protein M1814_004220 [Vezdaea aestivalis]|nr:MAG: hypothetical protein M1814_004220 [Vezdaea aestivalis]